MHGWHLKQMILKWRPSNVTNKINTGVLYCDQNKYFAFNKKLDNTKIATADN